MRKREIQYRIAKHLVDLGQFEESTLKDYEPESTSELRKLELELQTNLEIKKLELQMEKERQALEKEKIQMQLEMEERQREKDRQERLEMKRLELGQSGKFFPSDKFDITKHFRLVPPFQEKDVDKYFLHFEKIAQSLNWPKESWSMLLQSALVGKAREIYIQLSVEQASNYDSVKELILKGYELVPEAYRQKFRDCEKAKDQTYVEFARTKEQLFDRWCSSEKVSQNYDKLRQLVLIEEFKRCIRSDIKTFINEQKADTLEVAARLADDYSLTHKSSFLSKPSQSFSYRNNAGKFNSSFSSKNFSKDSRKSNDNSSQNSSNTPTSSDPKSQSPSDKQFGTLSCNYCKKDGHLMSDCFKLKRKREGQSGQSGSKPTGFISSSTQLESNNVCNTFSEVKPLSSPINEVKVNSSQDSIMGIFEPFIHDGFISLSSDFSSATPVKILRDTGASQSLLLADTLPFSEKSFSGSKVLIKGVDCNDYIPVPLHNVYLSSDFVSGPVTLGIRPFLPFEGIHLLLGNDLAGDKVITNPLVTDNPTLDQDPEPIEQEIPDLFPSCAITRAMSKKTSENQILSKIMSQMLT
ncbi:uncharacterized protein [Ptychodera flava]|uniref:uncharacterized protein n=1 Tax=Ptychodera flava TaxID=63121 RepID=UPI00396A5957